MNENTPSRRPNTKYTQLKLKSLLVHEESKNWEQILISSYPKVKKVAALAKMPFMDKTEYLIRLLESMYAKKLRDKDSQKPEKSQASHKLGNFGSPKYCMADWFYN